MYMKLANRNTETPSSSWARLATGSHLKVSRNWPQRPPFLCSKLTLCLSPGSFPSAFFALRSLSIKKKKGEERKKKHNKAKLPCSCSSFQLGRLYTFLHGIRLEFDFLYPSRYSPGTTMLPPSRTLRSGNCPRLCLSAPLYSCCLSVWAHVPHYSHYSGFVKWLNVCRVRFSLMTVFRVVVAIQIPLLFHMNFRNSFLTWIKEAKNFNWNHAQGTRLLGGILARSRWCWVFLRMNRE